MLTQPANTRAYIARSKSRTVAVYYLKPPKLNVGELACRFVLRRNLVRNLRGPKLGHAYRAALKYVSQLALPRFTGTIRLRRAHRADLSWLERAERAAGMVC